MKEVTINEYSELVKGLEMDFVLDLKLPGNHVAISVSGARVFFEFLEPRKCFVGEKEDVDYKSLIQKNAKKVKKVLEEEGALSVVMPELKKAG